MNADPKPQARDPTIANTGNPCHAGLETVNTKQVEKETSSLGSPVKDNRNLRPDHEQRECDPNNQGAKSGIEPNSPKAKNEPIKTSLKQKNNNPEPDISAQPYIIPDTETFPLDLYNLPGGMHSIDDKSLPLTESQISSLTNHG